MDALPAVARLALAIVRLAAWLVPGWHRASWRDQWEADLWARGRSLERRRELGLGVQADLAARALGVFRHALWLRGREWRVEMLMQDVRYGVRLLGRRPTFTAIAVLTLAIGIGATATIASWIESLVWRPLPGVEHADRLVDVTGTEGPRFGLTMSYPDFADMRDQPPPGVAGIVCGGLVPIVLRVGDQPDRVWGRVVSGNYFDILGVRAVLGRTFLPEEDRTPNTHPVAVLSHSFWLRRFHGHPAVVGSTVMLNEHAFVVIGVAAERFAGTDVALASDVFVPMMMQLVIRPTDLLHARGRHDLKVQALLTPGASLAQVQAGFDLEARRLARAYPDTNSSRGVAVLPLWHSPQEVSGIMGPVLALLMGMVGVVLLVASTNVASLLLARGAARQREVAVRLAVGASRVALVRQLLTESVLLALAGGAAGVVIAHWTSRLLLAFLPPLDAPILVDTGLSPRMFLVALAVAVVTGLVFGLAPALQGSRPELVPALKEGDQRSRAAGRALLRKGLVVAQVALSFLLLVMAGLFLRTLGYARSADPGFSMRTGILAAIDLQPGGYDADRGRALYVDLLQRLRAVPGVRAASLAETVPLGFTGGDMSIDVEGYVPAKDEQVTAYFNVVAPGYFETMGIPLVAGRAMDDRDTKGAPLTVVVNETMARRYWKGAGPIGRRVRYNDAWAAVVGVAKDGKYETLTESQRPYLYVPLYQLHRSSVVLHVRTDGDPTPLVASVRQAVKAAAPHLPLFCVRTMEEHLQVAVFMMRMAAMLLGAFGAIALLLATLGLYGVVAQAVAQRTRELGIRVALGAARADVLRLVMRQGLATTLVGLGLGLVLALGATRLVASLLVGVGPLDPVAFVGMATLLVAATVTASYLPARRAATQDPLRALRHE